MWGTKQIKPTSAGAARGPDRPGVERDRLRQVRDQHVDFTRCPIRGVQSVERQRGIFADIIHQPILNNPDRSSSPTVGGFGLRDHLRGHPRPNLPYVHAWGRDGIGDRRVREHHSPSESTLDVRASRSVAARCRTGHYFDDYRSCARSRAAENIVQTVVETAAASADFHQGNPRPKRKPPHQARDRR